MKRCDNATGLLSVALRATSLATGLALFFAVQGCGKTAPSKASSTETATAATKPAAKPNRAAEPAEKSAGPKKKDSGIPYDAFFDDPLEVASNAAVVGGARPESQDTKQPMEQKPATPQPAPAAASGGSGGSSWSDYVTVDDLQDELKKVRNRLTAALANQATYGTNVKDKSVSVDGAVVAALASVVIDSGSDVSWKKNAPFVRDCGLSISESAVGLSKDDYDKTKAAFEKMTAALSGETPDGSPAPKRPINEVCSRSGLMKRIDKARNWMKDNINTESKLKSESEAILHEAAMIAMLGKAVTAEGFTSADEPEYQQYAKSLIDGAQEASSAVKDQAYKKFTESIDKINKSCTDCHNNYGK